MGEEDRWIIQDRQMGKGIQIQCSEFTEDE